MDPAYHPAIVVQCDFCVCPEWPFPHHDSIYVQIWFDRDDDSMPDFPAVWGAWAQGREGAPDTAAITVPVPPGQVICDSGSFWVGYMMDTVHEAGNEVVMSDGAMNYPDHQVYYYPAGDTWEYWPGSDMMIRSWTFAPIPGYVRGMIIEPSGQIRAGDSVTPRVQVMNLGTSQFEGWVWMRIEHTCSTDNYLDSIWLCLYPMSVLEVTYRTWTPLYPGVYRMQCTANSNDTNWTYLTVLPRTGLEQGDNPQASVLKPQATVVHGVLYLPPASDVVRHASSVLLDISGREVMELRPGPNDVSRMSPGVYFIRKRQAAVGPGPSAVRRVVVAR
jgi:hypothetical protein